MGSLAIKLQTSSPQSQHQMQHGTTLDLVVGSGFIVVPMEVDQKRISQFLTLKKKVSNYLHLLSGKDESLLLGRNTFLLLDTLLDSVHFVGGFDVDFNLLASQSLMWGGGGRVEGVGVKGEY